jgi:predicted XRE-type DNA-binding protein
MIANKYRSTDGTDTVFADLGLPNSEQGLIQAQLTLQIQRLIRPRGLTQAQAAELPGVKQPQVSLLMRNRSGNFSISRLIGLLNSTRAGRRSIAVPN